jgi:secreted Zn-dependent insulinase-like peptidase
MTSTIINKSFKDIIKKQQYTPVQIKNDKQYTYDEFIKLQDDKRKTKESLIPKKYSETTMLFIDEQTINICNYLNIMKDENSSKGFLNVINLVMNNVTTNQISPRDDENDQSLDEDDYY